MKETILHILPWVGGSLPVILFFIWYFQSNYNESKEHTNTPKNNQRIKVKLRKTRFSRRKKLLLIGLPVAICLLGAGYAFWRYKHHKTFSPQDLFNQRTKEINKMVESISKINDPSIRLFLSEEYICPMRADIKEHLRKGHALNSANDLFIFYYAPGLIKVFQMLDEKIQEYRKIYDDMSASEKNSSVDPYSSIISKSGGYWHQNPKNPISFYFASLPYTAKYTIGDLYAYLNDFIYYVPINPPGELSKSECENRAIDAKIFLQKHKLYIYEYEPEELANCIIKEILEFNAIDEFWLFKDLESMFDIRYCFNGKVNGWISCNIDTEDAIVHIKRAIIALGPKRYLEALRSVGINGIESNHLTEMVRPFAKRLKEKATKEVIAPENDVAILMKRGLSREQAIIAAKEGVIRWWHEIVVKGSFR